MDNTLGKDNLTKEDILFLLDARDSQEKLFAAADKVRECYIGDEIHIRGIIEFSNYCRNDCLYCGIRRSNLKLKRYRLSPEEIIEIAQNASNLGYKTVLLQSGEDEYYSVDMIEKMIRRILEKCDCRVALSIGERSIEDYKRFYLAGARRCLVRFETSNEGLFSKLHPKSSAKKNSLKERIDLLKGLKSIGFQLGTGFMIGLPDQSSSDIADDILLLKELGADMAGIGPFLVHTDTPLKGSSSGDFDLSLRVIALVRLVCKDIFIPATTALQTLNMKDGRQRALRCGANLLMPNITPQKYRPLYQLYPNKACVYEAPSDCSACVRRIITSLGRQVGSGYGDHKDARKKSSGEKR